MGRPLSRESLRAREPGGDCAGGDALRSVLVVTSPEPTSGPPVPRRSWVAQVMGLPVSVLARGQDACAPETAVAVAALYAELQDVDAMFSPYRSESEVSRVAGGELALDDADPLVQEVAARCVAARELTGGRFDAKRPDGRWDPSGLVKGWAVERAARHLRALCTVDWCLNAGGDVVVIAPSGEPFRVGVQDPHDAARVATIVPQSEGAVATSGTAARGNHLYDPRTGSQAVASASLTVVGPSLERADVLATAAFVAGADALAFVTAHAGYEALRIGTDGVQSCTADWPGSR